MLTNEQKINVLFDALETLSIAVQRLLPEGDYQEESLDSVYKACVNLWDDQPDVAMTVHDVEEGL